MFGDIQNNSLFIIEIKKYQQKQRTVGGENAFLKQQMALEAHRTAEHGGGRDQIRAWSCADRPSANCMFRIQLSVSHLLFSFLCFLSTHIRNMSRKSQSTLDKWIKKPVAEEEEEVAPLEDLADQEEETNE